MVEQEQDWGRRLSDAIRAAIATGDLAQALRLGREGDGQARSLAKEFTFMFRGLGIAIRAMLPLLGDVVARSDAASHRDMTGEAAALLHGFHAEFLALMRQTWGDTTTEVAAMGALEQELAGVVRVLATAEQGFEREQQRLADEILAAIATGAVAEACALLDTKERTHFLRLHDRLIRFMAEYFGWVLRRAGPEALLQLHLATAEAQRAGFEKWEQLGAAEFARLSAFLLRQHMGAVMVREDAEKYTLEQTPCGSGGRLRLAGAYTGENALPFVETPGPLTFGQARFPVYCSHCPIWNGVAPLRWFDRVQWVFENPARADGSCTLHVYKQRDGAPAAYLQQLAAKA